MMKRHRIRKHSPLDIMIKLMAACGFILVVGSVGYDEMMTEIHVYYPLVLTILKAFAGFALMTPWCLIQLSEQNDEATK